MKKLAPLLLVLAFMVSCSLPDTLSALLDRQSSQNTPAMEANDLMTLIANNSISVVSTRGNPIVASFSGRTIDLELVNNTDKTLEVLIPCGLTFIPTDEAASRMISVQSHEITIEPAEVKKIMPFVLSMDNLEALPTADKSYRLEHLTKGKQLEFAECLCRRDLPAEIETNDLVSAQLAMWMLDESSAITDLPDELNEWLQDAIGLPITIPGLDNALQNLTGNLAPEAKAWLEKCGIELDN